MKTDSNFPHRLYTSDSVLLPPNKKDLDILMSLTAGSFNSELLMLVDVEDRSITRIDQEGFSESLIMNLDRGRKPLSHPKQNEYIFIDSPAFRPSMEDQNPSHLNPSSLAIVDVENFIPLIFGEAGTSDRRHHFDPDELLSVDIPQGRGSPEKMLHQTSHPVPLNNAAISQKTSTCSAA
jgi:hypothetical protein